MSENELLSSLRLPQELLDCAQPRTVPDSPRSAQIQVGEGVIKGVTYGPT